MIDSIRMKQLTLICFAALGFSAFAQSAGQAVLAPTASQPSAEFSPQSVLGAMKKVADWQLTQPPKRPTDDWTYGALYAGMMALGEVSDIPKYQDAMLAMGKAQEWKPARRIYDADDQCVCQTYLQLYMQHRDPAMLGPTKERFDYILAHPATNDLRYVKGNRKRWSWCDALFMAPPAWLELYAATSDRKYLDFMDREWQAASDFLYDKQEHLCYRDSTYFEKREANGKKVFWSRGNGWVMAGLARVLQVLPPEHSQRKVYQQQYQEMAVKIAALQREDGLWRSSLLDPDSYPLKETSGSGFFTFALAWGVNRGVLDRPTYEPVVRKAWRGLTECVTPEGKLEHVQPVGADPKRFEPTNSDVYGVGAFLLAGSEMYRLALWDLPAAAYGAFMPQRKDDVAWENDRIAFRVYGPALEATGEVSSGIDVWVKRTRKPVVEKWYYLAQYHKDHGEGLDMYKVAPAGAAAAPVSGGTASFAWLTILSPGACSKTARLRVAFELGYAPYDAGGIKVRETRRFSLETGSNLNRIETRFDWDGGPDELRRRGHRQTRRAAARRILPKTVPGWLIGSPNSRARAPSVALWS